MSKITSECSDNAAVFHDAVADTELFVSAEDEIAAFYTAVTQNYGAAQAGLAALDWLQEVEQADWSMADGIPNWRSFTYTAAAKLAERICANDLLITWRIPYEALSDFVIPKGLVAAETRHDSSSDSAGDRVGVDWRIEVRGL